MKYLLICLLVLINFTSIACLNEEHVTKHGQHTSGNFTVESLTFYKGQDIPAIELKLKTLLGLPAQSEEDKRSIQNDIAVQYIKLGRFEEAEKLLLELKKKYPGNYSINANLGTLYELQGKNKEALQLIKSSVAIDPDSHQGSEWFHIKILEYKLKNIPGDKVSAQNILGLYSLKKTADAIADEVSYQLKERIPFTPAPNLMMAKVLQEFADFLADSVSIKASYLMYGIAMDYDRNNTLQLAAKKEALLPYFKKYHEAVPVLNSYYLDPIIQIIKDDPGKVVSTVLENGMNYFNRQDEIRKEKERQRNVLIAVAVGIVGLAGAALYFRNRKKKQLAE